MRASFTSMQRLACKLLAGCTVLQRSSAAVHSAPERAASSLFQMSSTAVLASQRCLASNNENAVVAQSEIRRREQVPQIHPRHAGPREMGVAWTLHLSACMCSPACRGSWGVLECCRLVSTVPAALQDGIINFHREARMNNEHL